MVVLIVIISLLFIATLFIGGDRKTEVMDEYCRTECWSWKIKKLRQCC